MEDAKNGKLDLILITKLDRGFKNVVDAIQNIEALDKFKVSLVILDMGGNVVDLSTPLGRFMVVDSRDRCNSGRKDRKAEGKRIGEVPFGYNLGPDNLLIPNETEQEILSTIHDLKSRGETLQSIAGELNARG